MNQVTQVTRVTQVNRVHRRIYHDILEVRECKDTGVWYFPDPSQLLHGYGVVLAGRMTPYVIEFSFTENYPYRSPSCTILNQPDVITHILLTSWCSTMSVLDLLRMYKKILQGRSDGLKSELTNGIAKLSITTAVKEDIILTLRSHCRQHNTELLEQLEKLEKLDAGSLQWFKDTFVTKIKICLRYKGRATPYDPLPP